MSPDQFASELVQTNQVPLLMGEVLRGKALAVVLEAATVTDTSGRPVDLEALRDDADEDIDQAQTIEYVGEPDEAAAEPGTAEPGTAEPGTAEPGTAESATAELGTAEPGTAESGTVGNSDETADPAHSPTV